MTAGALFHGRVFHRRLKPVGHQFAYRVFSLLVDVDDIARAASRLKWFSLDRPNLFALYAKDHGARAGETIGEHARALLRDAGYAADGRIDLLCYPRILGFVFNPLSIYWCRNACGALEAVIYEVRNTFGGRHCYVIPAVDAGGTVRQAADKMFHVSPFMEMDMRYNFELSEPLDTVRVLIREDDREGPILVASFEGAREALSDGALLRAFFRYPLMTLKIVGAIHFEAARLFAKGLRLKSGAPDPANEATHVARPIIGRSS